MRASGILLPLSSLPGPHGIGTLGREAYRFVDFLAAAGQAYWQMLPVGPTSYGDSPYQSFSAFAASPYYIDLDLLRDEGFLTQGEIDAARLEGEGGVDYAAQFSRRLPLLRLAAGRFDDTYAPYRAFCEKEKDWLEDYALFMALKEENGQQAFSAWPDAVRTRRPGALAAARKRLARQVRAWKVFQYWFSVQWGELRAYAHGRGVRLIGDMPIYISADSADLWAAPHLFQLDAQGRPTEVAGVPPDAFTADGQLWGNPLYNWDVMERDGYAWWLRRLRAGFALFDVLRIDHFRGFESYYAVPFGDKTAVNGRWRPGPGLPFIRALRREYGKGQIIAEDLGYLTPAVRKLLRASGYPGMKILQFAFDSREESDYLPHRYGRNCVVYTGTHDNDTVQGWMRSAPRADVRFACEYLHVTDRRQAHWAFARAALSSVADLAVVPMQDYLGLGGEARVNTPSTLGGNWCWRMAQGAASAELAARIARMVKIYGRSPKRRKG